MSNDPEEGCGRILENKKSSANHSMRIQPTEREFSSLLQKVLRLGNLDPIVKLSKHPNRNGIEKKSPSQTRKITKTFKTAPKKPTHKERR